MGLDLPVEISDLLLVVLFVLRIDLNILAYFVDLLDSFIEVDQVTHARHGGDTKMDRKHLGLVLLILFQRWQHLDLGFANILQMSDKHGCQQLRVVVIITWIDWNVLKMNSEVINSQLLGSEILISSSLEVLDSINCKDEEEANEQVNKDHKDTDLVPSHFKGTPLEVWSITNTDGNSVDSGSIC